MRVLGLSVMGAIAALASALLGVAAPAVADIQYTNFEVANDVNVTLTCNSLPNCTSGYYGSGQIDLYNNGTAVADIWCVDVTHDLQGPWSNSGGGTTYTFNVTPWHNEGGGLSNIWSGGAVGLGTQLTNRVVGEIGALARYGDENLSSNYYVSSAVQLAIWDIEYNHGALNLDGALTEKSDSPQTQSLAETLVGDVVHGKLGHDTHVAWLTCAITGGACNQGQLEVLPRAVPEPPGLALLGSGLLALAGFAALQSRRRKSTAFPHQT